MSIKERLAQMQKGFIQSKAQYDQKFGGIKIDEGEYVGKLSRCSLDIRKSDDSIVVSVEYTIMEGKFKGFATFDQMNLGNEWGRLFAIRFVELSGFEFPEDVTLLDATIQEIAKQAGTYEITAKKNGDYINISPKQMLEEVANEEVANEEVVKEEVKKKAVTPQSKSIVRDRPTKQKEDVEEREKNEDSTEITIESINAMDRKELKQLITEKDIELRVTTKHSDDDIRKALITHLGLKMDLPEEDESVEVPTDDELKMDLLVFCKSHKIKSINKDMDLDTMITTLENHKFDRESLEEDEIKLLTMLAIESCIEN